jgi:uncharacterized protein (TIGR02117 family)
MKLLRRLLRILAIFPGLLLLYLLAAVIGSLIPVSAENTAISPKEAVLIYIKTNGVHTDLVMPLQNAYVDWTQTIDTNHARNASNAQWCSIGWGDKKFYIETPEWSDLTVSTAVGSTFGFHQSAMHVVFYPLVLPSKRKRALYLSPEQYQRLHGWILDWFELDSNGQVIPIPTGNSYGPNDVFYEAKGRYHLFHTCNTWTNQALKVAGQRAAWWTPFDKGIFYHYPEVAPIP